jgi:Spy/CpxP family protein refolding chaperone
LRGAIADQILAGKIDRAALKPQLDAVVAASDAARPEDRAAIVRLHDVLDAGQRSELVSSIETSFRARREARKGGGPRQWAEDLNLTDAQRDQLRAVLREQFHREGEGARPWQAAHEEGRRLLHSFREEKFALDGQAPVFGRDRMERGIDRMLALAEAALPILKPEQRAIAAQKIREGRHGMH